MDFFSSEQIDGITDSVFDNIGYSPSIRKILLSSINKDFRALLNTDGNELIQLQLDLIQLNKTPKLTDGTVPFESWLEKAARFLKPFPDASRVIQQSLAAIGQVSANTPVSDPQPPSAQKIDDIIKEKTIHQNDMVSYAFLEGGFHAGNAVARIKVKRFDNGAQRLLNNQPAIYLGTCWLLARDLVITNYHVINARENNEVDAKESDFALQAINAVAQFDYNADNMEGINANCIKLEVADAGLDFAILRLDPAGERIPLQLRPQKVVIEADKAPVVNIIQHPYGYSKKVALRNNNIYDSTYPRVRYFTDTEGGSSGSPVFNDNWEVIALHRASTLVDNVTYNGQKTAWVNEGVQLEAIMQYLKINNNDLYKEVTK